MKAILVIPLLLMIISANQQNSSQHFPQDYRSIMLDLKNIIKKSQLSIEIYSSLFDHPRLSKSLQKAAQSGIMISVFIPKGTLTPTLKELALYKNFSIFFTSGKLKNISSTTIMFDKKQIMNFSLPLDESILKNEKGKVLHNVKKRDLLRSNKLFNELGKQSTNYFLD
ncbi:MAG: hypothetical protein OEW60_01405 [Thiovulaceae bacterium]|nr:hypothetical protein [Sulfurimonadaceae bacterium]